MVKFFQIFGAFKKKTVTNFGRKIILDFSDLQKKKSAVISEV